MNATHEFNAKNLVKYNSKIKNLTHANHIISILQDYATQQNITELEARNELFVNNECIILEKENGNIPSIIEQFSIDATTLEIYYECFWGRFHSGDVNKVNGDYPYKYTYNDAIDKKVIKEWFDAVANAMQEYLDMNDVA
jgi:hypothetical protein